MVLSPTTEECARRDRVIEAIREHIRNGQTIRLPAFDRAAPSPSLEPNEFDGTVGDFRYQFEGEEDLLHIIVVRSDGSPVAPEAGLAVARFLMPDIPPALVWLKPGEYSHHLYLGHDDLPGIT